MRKKCDCGSPLPIHLFEVAKKFPGPFGHVCICERSWKWNDDKSEIVYDGTKENPSARVDAKIASGEISLDEVPKC